MAKLREFLGRAWERRFPQGTKPPWARDLQPSHIQKWIMRAVARYPDAALSDVERLGGLEAGSVRQFSLPCMDSELEYQTGIEMRSWIDTDGCWAIVAALATIANERAVAVRRHFTGLDAALRPATTSRRISEWACSLVARPYAVAPTLPRQGHLDDKQAMFQQREVDRAARVKNLVTAAEFVDQYTAVYKGMWDLRGGGPSAITPSPVELKLGKLDRPPMKAMKADENSWRVGTDRSVQSRYRYYLRSSWGRDPESVAEAAGLEPDQHIGIRLLAVDPDVLCRGELDRACSPLGLRFPGHHALLMAMVKGVQDADLESAYDLRKSLEFGPNPPEECEPTVQEEKELKHKITTRKGRRLTDWAAVTHDLLTEDKALVTAVQEYAEYWAFRGPKALELATGATPLIHWPTQVQLGAPRRLWHRLHCREVEWEAPLLRAEAARLVPQMFQNHLLELLKQPIHELDADSESPVSDYDSRLNTTLGALAKDQASTEEMGNLLRQGDDERWKVVYKRITERCEERCLTITEIYDFALCNLVDLGESSGGR